MNTAGAIFAEITTALEDMHGVAVEGQSLGLAAGEGWVLLASLRDSVQRIGRLMADVALTLE